jgi:hypothetical protein
MQSGGRGNRRCPELVGRRCAVHGRLGCNGEQRIQRIAVHLLWVGLVVFRARLLRCHDVEQRLRRRFVQRHLRRRLLRFEWSVPD